MWRMIISRVFLVAIFQCIFKKLIAVAVAVEVEVVVVVVVAVTLMSLFPKCGAI